MPRKILFCDRNGDPVWTGKKSKKKKQVKRVTEPTPMANRVKGDRRMDRAIEDGPAPLTREQHMAQIQAENEESRLENRRLRDEYEAYKRKMRHLKVEGV